MAEAARRQSRTRDGWLIECATKRQVECARSPIGRANVAMHQQHSSESGRTER